jgi:beta-lactam-binding protein with PASTA domain/predicted Ser/Thr protein kinase
MTMEPTTIGGGRYRLGGLLGRGGMAEVRSAEDLRLGRTVAIKRLRADLASDPTFQARFRREAQSAASLNHPTIVAVYDTGEEFATDGSGLMLPYIVMEYVEGRTLRDILREGRRILPERALEITGSVLDALDYSHRAGIIHRDIKPANVMLTPAGDVKVMDFGIARAIADSSATMTQTAAVVGTAQYLSPEQARGEQVDARSDLYSAGCVLFELLTGRPPFVGDSPVSVAYQHVREEAPAPSTVDREISPTIDAITLKALTKRVDDRYQSAAEMRADIDRALDGRPVLAPAVYGGQETEHFLPPAPRDPVPTTVGGPPVSHRDEPPSKRRTWLWVLLVLLLACAAIAAAFIVPKLLADDPVPTVEVPKITGLTELQASRLLEEQGLKLNECDTVNGTQKNKIINQDPGEGDRAEEGSTVDCTVSVGPKSHLVPDVTDLTLAEATAALEKLNFVVSPEEDDTSTEKKNEVIATDPPANTRLAEGQTITVTYSGGWILVESFVGRTQDEAVQRLQDELGFNVVVSNAPSDEPAGTVVAQDPENEKQPYGSTVVITVSLGPTETTDTTTTTPTTPTESTATTGEDDRDGGPPPDLGVPIPPAATSAFEPPLG